MAFAAFSDHFALYDVTPVENIFLLEYMPYAPGDYVRVYLYTLMLCRYPEKDESMEDVAKALGMTPDQVLEALRYWEKKGLVEGLSDHPPRFLFRNVRSALLEQTPEENPAYAYSDFNDQLQKILGILHPQQFRTAMEWVEEMRLPTDVVLLMVEKTNELLTLKNGGKPRSVNYVFKTLKERAMDWASREINTLEKAQMEIEKELPPYRIAKEVLGQMGLRRAPTAAEVSLCRKWMEEWLYDEAGILSALPETTKSANPSFAYLDGILAARHGRGEGQTDVYDAVKQVLHTLGSRSQMPTAGLTEMYSGFLRQGFAPETILRAAGLCNMKGQGTFEKLGDVLGKWLRLGLTTPDAVDEYLEKRASLRQITLAVREKAGMSGEITDAALDQVQEWLTMASPEVLEYAASCANGLKLPDRSITKRLKEYQAAGVTSLEQARTFKRPEHEHGSKRGTEKPDLSLNYAQRTMDEKYFEGIFANLDVAAREEDAE